MQFEQSRRQFLSHWRIGVLPFPLAMSACAGRTSQCNARNWEIAPQGAGKFFDCYHMSVLGDVADLVVESPDRSSASDTQVISDIDDMISDWAGPGLKVRLARLPNYLDIYALSSVGEMYPFLPRDKRTHVLASFDAAAFAEPETDASTAYRAFKSLLLRFYLSSAETNPDYAHVPGGYYGDLSESQYQALLRERAEGFTG